MLHISTTDPGYVSLFGRIGKIVSELLATRRERARQQADRRTFLNLRHLDDRILDDIGITRAEVYEASELPLEMNASMALRTMAAERRAQEAARRHRH